MKKSVIVLVHIGFWFCYVMLILIILGIVWGDDRRVWDARFPQIFKVLFSFVFLPSAFAFYSFYLVLFPRYLQQKKFFMSIIYGILLSVCAGIAGYYILIHVAPGNCFGKGKSQGSPADLIIFNSFLAMVIGIIAWVIKGFVTWFEEVKLKEVLKEKNQEMEMALVKSQLDPHFLFNTINNIDVLILRDPAAASDYLNNLSDIMRFMLYETKSDTILLAKEIEYIAKYVELQKIRTSNINYAHFSVIGITGNRTIAPMVFIPFIENAFKHCANKKLDHAITITIFIEKNFIKFMCENKYNPYAKKVETRGGLGNNLIQKRLQLIYTDKHNLETIIQDDTYKVSLTIYNG